VYNGLLKKDRREIHERIGLVIEELFHDRLTEFYETLAYHFKLGKSLHKAVNYLMKSGEKSLKRYALEEANNYYTEAFELLSKKSDKSTEENELLIDLIIKWAYVHYYKGDIKGWVELFLGHKTLAESLPVTERVGMFFAWLGFAFLGNDNRKSIHYLQEALKMGEKLQNQKIIGYANTWLAFTYADLGLLDQAIQFGNKAQEIANQIESDQYLFFKSLAGLGIAYISKGEVDRLKKVANKLIKYGQQYSNIRSQTLGYIYLGAVYYLVGNFQQQNKYLQKALEVSSDPYYDYIAKASLSPGYILNGQFLEAEKLLSEVAAFSNQNHTDWIGTPAKVFQGIVMIAKGSMGKGLKTIEEALATLNNNERKYYIARTEQILGKIYLQIIEGAGPLRPLILARNIGFLVKNVPFADKKAESHLNKAIEIATEIGAKGILASAYLDLGLLHKAKKRYKQAKVYILKAMNIFEEWEAELYLKQAKEALSDLE
jgi:tetratricopeptide (TPR) repeat protein